MSLLDRYIAKHVLGGLLVVLLVIVGLDMVFSLLEELGDLRGDYTFLAALQYIGLTIPSRLYEYIPLSSLIGCLIGLGLLASSSELTVMRAAGISTLQIILSVMKPVVVVILITLSIGEFVVPVSEPYAQSQRQIKLTQGGTVNSANHLWHRDDMTFIHIDAVDTDGSIRGVTRYELNPDLTLARSSVSELGRYEAGQWRLQNVQETRFDHEAKVTQVATREEESWQSGLTPELLRTVMVEPDNLSITGLLNYSRYLAGQGLNAASYRVAFWNKLLLPLAIFSLVLVAVSFIFGPLRSVTIGQRLITGVVIGVVFKISQEILGPTSTVFGFSPLIAVLLPIIVCLGAGLWLLQRAK